MTAVDEVGYYRMNEIFTGYENVQPVIRSLLPGNPSGRIQGVEIPAGSSSSRIRASARQSARRKYPASDR